MFFLVCGHIGCMQMQPPDAGFTVALEIKLDALPMDDGALSRV